MKRKRTRQQIIKDIFSIPEVRKLIRELQKIEPKIDNVPHAWTPKDGVIYDFVETPKNGLDVFLENTLTQTLYKEDVVGADIGEDNFGHPYPSQIRAVNGRAIGMDVSVEKARLEMEKAGQLPIGLGGDCTYQKLKEQEKNRITHAFWEKEYINWLTWKHIWIWVKRRIHVSK